jgi:hypothetical protein
MIGETKGLAIDVRQFDHRRRFANQATGIIARCREHRQRQARQ